MAKETADVLGELYAWDSTIDEVYDLPENDSARDEDQALEAYEEVIHVVSQPNDNADAVLSLAAQLLTKHFFKFPHVHMNVVEGLLALCKVERPQAVRIHTIRSLLQIVKTADSDGQLSSGCLERISSVMRKNMASETSGVILRHMTQLSKAIQEREASDSKETSRPEVASKSRNEESSAPVQNRSLESPRTVAMPRVAADAASGKQRNDDSDYNKGYSRYDDRKENASNGNGDSPAGKPLGNRCPPGPYLFIGNLPREIPSSALAEFLLEVDPTMTNGCVQIKQPQWHNTAYAFVSFPSTQLAREAIRFITSVKFQGRFLNGNFARGPPCDTLLFMERKDKSMNMVDDDAVREVDFDAYDRSVWEDLCEFLERFGPIQVLRKGKVRFLDVEHAKIVIRKNHLMIQHYEIIPVYDPEVQLGNDSSRNKRGKQGFALKSGRVVGEKDLRSPYHNNDRDRHYGDDRRDSRRGRTPSPPRILRSRSRSPGAFPGGKKLSTYGGRQSNRSQSRSLSPGRPPYNGRSSADGARSGKQPEGGKMKRGYERGRPQSPSRSPPRVRSASRDRGSRPVLDEPMERRGRPSRDQDHFEERGRRESGASSRYGPIESVNDRFNEQRDERRGPPSRDFRQSPELAKPQPYNRPQGPWRDEQRGRSRSPKKIGGKYGSSRHSISPPPVIREPSRGYDQQQRRGDSFRGREDRGGYERTGRSGPPSESDRYDGERSIADIAREEEEKLRNRRDTGAGKFAMGGRGDYHAPSPRGGRSSGYGGSQHRSQSPGYRSRSPGPLQSQFRPQKGHGRDYARDDRRSSPPPSGTKGYSGRDFGKQDHRDSRRPNGGNRDQSPPPSPYLVNERQRSPSITNGRQHRSKTHHSSRHSSGDRDRSRRDDYQYQRRDDGSRERRPKHSGNKTRGPANDMESRRYGAASSPNADAPAVAKRARSMTPSPVRRDNYTPKHGRRSSPSPQGSMDGDDNDRFDKKRRVDDSDEGKGVTAKQTESLDEIDECVVDYEEDDD